MIKINLTVALILMGMAINAQSIVGKWKTIDDNSGDPRSVVEISQTGDEYFGKIIRLFPRPDEDPDPVCDECEDHRKGQKVVGMQILEGLEQDGEEYSGGKILDPENGKIYRCKLWLEDGKLKVRGYLYFFYRTQTWLPFD